MSIRFRYAHPTSFSSCQHRLRQGVQLRARSRRLGQSPSPVGSRSRQRVAVLVSTHISRAQIVGRPGRTAPPCRDARRAAATICVAPCKGPPASLRAKILRYHRRLRQKVLRVLLVLRELASISSVTLYPPKFPLQHAWRYHMALVRRFLGDRDGPPLHAGTRAVSPL